MKDLLLVLSGLITLGAVIPYLRDIVRGQTKPNLVSWITWTMLTGLATAAEIAAHEYRTAIFTGAAVLETGSVVVFGLRHGYVKYTRFDVLCQLAAIVGLILWQIFNTPLLAVIASVTIDFIGVLPTFRHAWHKPFEETWITFALSGLGGLVAIFALTAFNWTSLTYPVYIVIVNILVSSLIISRQRELAPQRA